MAIELKNNVEFYDKCSKTAKENYEEFFSQRVWTERIKKEL